MDALLIVSAGGNQYLYILGVADGRVSTAHAVQDPCWRAHHTTFNRIHPFIHSFSLSLSIPRTGKQKKPLT